MGDSPSSAQGSEEVADGSAITREAKIATLKAERERIAYRLKELNQQMIDQSVEERRTNWTVYNRQLGELMKRQAEITESLTGLDPSDSGPPSGV
jgi:hypothetical protein